MTARLVTINGILFPRCDECAWERHAPTRPTADRLIHQHNNQHHRKEK